VQVRGELPCPWPAGARRGGIEGAHAHERHRVVGALPRLRRLCHRLSRRPREHPRELLPVGAVATEALPGATCQVRLAVHEAVEHRHDRPHPQVRLVDPRRLLDARVRHGGRGHQRVQADHRRRSPGEVLEPVQSHRRALPAGPCLQLAVTERRRRVGAYLRLREALRTPPGHRRHRRQRRQPRERVAHLRHQRAQVALLRPGVERVVAAHRLPIGRKRVLKALEQPHSAPERVTHGLLCECVEVVVHHLQRHHRPRCIRPQAPGCERREGGRNLTVKPLLGELAERELPQRRVSDRLRPLLAILQLDVHPRPHAPPVAHVRERQRPTRPCDQQRPTGEGRAIASPTLRVRVQAKHAMPASRGLSRSRARSRLPGRRSRTRASPRPDRRRESRSRGQGSGR
jgi:hypothetical protein